MTDRLALTNALVLALDLAKLSGAELHMICVEEISEFPEIAR